MNKNRKIYEETIKETSEINMNKKNETVLFKKYK